MLDRMALIASLALAGVDIGCDAARAESCVRWGEVSASGPPAGSAELAFDRSRGVTVAFMWPSRETWEWDGVTWTHRETPIAPPPSYGPRMIYDSHRQVVVLYGGYAGSQWLSDIWEWNGVAWVLRSPPTSPPPRDSHAMCYDSNRHVAVVYGGRGPGGYSDDLWEYDGTTWTQRTPSGPRPGVRVNHVMAFDSTHGVCVLAAGAENSTWTWDGVAWALASSTGPMQQAPVMTFDEARSRVVLFGGGDSPAGISRWEWDGADWAPIAGAAPPDRAWAGMSYDTERQVCTIYGGYGLATYGDTWELSNRGAPSITSEPGPQSVSIGQAAIFAVSSAGDPSLSYRWRRNGTPLDNGGNISGALSPTLIINPATVANAGEYDVMVTNACGTATSDTAALVVTIPCYGDTNGDLLVNFVDLNYVLGNFGANCHP